MTFAALATGLLVVVLRGDRNQIGRFLADYMADITCYGVFITLTSCLTTPLCGGTLHVFPC